MRHLGQEQHVPPDTSGLASLQLAYMTGSPPLAQTTSNAKSACWISSYESSSEPVSGLDRVAADHAEGRALLFQHADQRRSPGEEDGRARGRCPEGEVGRDPIRCRRSG